jgi:hypothetical protein
MTTLRQHTAYYRTIHLERLKKTKIASNAAAIQTGKTRLTLTSPSQQVVVEAAL